MREYYLCNSVLVKPYSFFGPTTTMVFWRNWVMEPVAITIKLYRKKEQKKKEQNVSWSKD